MHVHIYIYIFICIYIKPQTAKPSTCTAPSASPRGMLASESSGAMSLLAKADSPNSPGRVVQILQLWSGNWRIVDFSPGADLDQGKGGGGVGTYKTVKARFWPWLSPYTFPIIALHAQYLL